MSAHHCRVCGTEQQSGESVDAVHVASLEAAALVDAQRIQELEAEVAELEAQLTAPSATPDPVESPAPSTKARSKP